MAQCQRPANAGWCDGFEFAELICWATFAALHDGSLVGDGLQIMLLATFREDCQAQESHAHEAVVYNY